MEKIILFLDILDPYFLLSLEWLTVSAILENSLERKISPRLFIGP